MTRMSILALFLASIGVLAGCASSVEQQRLPSLSYGHLGALNLDTARIEVASEFVAPLKAPNIEHQVPEAPEKAMRQWGNDRLLAAGKSGTARLTILDSSVTETRLPMDKGISGAFKKEQASRFDSAVEARLELFDDRGFRRGIAAARVTLSRTIGEEATLNERDKALFTLVEDLMKQFNVQMEANIREHLGGFLF